MKNYALDKIICQVRQRKLAGSQNENYDFDLCYHKIIWYSDSIFRVKNYEFPIVYNFKGSGGRQSTKYKNVFGGDEFVIVMQETEKNVANVLAERLQKKLSRHSFENHKLPIKNTVSIGIASFPNDAKNISELIHNADTALYKAKKEGGNRICNFNIQYKTTEKFKL